MDLLQIIIEAVYIVLSWPTIGWVLAGILLGIILGAIPGIGPVVGMAVILPFTFALDGGNVILLFACMYLGGMYGSSISAILINAPGTAAAAATTLDGYPMSRKGEAVTALAISATASAFGGMLTALTLLLIGPFLITVVLIFGSPEYFLIALIGIAMITIVAKGALIKGLTVGSFGLALTTIGTGGQFITPRFTFGTLALRDGISFVAVLIGLFALAEMIKLSSEKGSISKEGFEVGGKMRQGIIEVIKRPVDVVKSGYIGMIVGSIPGAGASVSNFVSYSEGKRSDKDPDSFGTGNPRGVLTAEASNSGTAAGSIIPTITFGIPGSASTAMLLGAFIMHGLRPGPQLFTQEIVFTYSLFVALVVGNIFILALGLILFTKSGILTKIDTNILIPMIIALAVLGSFALRTLWIDVVTMVIFGIAGYFMTKHNYSVIAVVLGVVLGPIAEENLYRSLSLSGGSFDIFVARPISILMVLILFALILGPIFKPLIKIIFSKLSRT